jgi:hypothetical protein
LALHTTPPINALTAKASSNTISAASRCQTKIRELLSSGGSARCWNRGSEAMADPGLDVDGCGLGVGWLRPVCPVVAEVDGVPEALPPAELRS